ncbi:MAG: DUF3179 domain-containing protein [bacterium]|nr:DUF3179 domain-containing protein [bacterium]
MRESPGHRSRRHPGPAARILVVALGIFLMLVAIAVQPRAEITDRAVTRAFLTLIAGEADDRAHARVLIEAQWEPSFMPMALEVMRLTRSAEVSGALVGIMQRKTGAGHGHDMDAWQREMWNAPEARHPRYAAFKSALYSIIDPRFSAYFDTDRTTLIRLDEIVWGGVRQDGIPPLRSPAMLSAESAGYLEDGDIVFGLSVNGDARAYPKRILAWHEMFVDTVGGVPVAGVYCTLCGTVILYHTEHEGVNHALGTSGFLYRSNKLMYDQATQSLWSTMRGAPVVGPLAGQGIVLERGSVVTTTWSEWRRRHPETLVLSLDTGHLRDYAEGAAYRDYFATDELMFPVPALDTRLKNKDEVFTVLLDRHPEAPLAISAEFLAATPVHHDAIEDTSLVVLTDPSGANRAFASEDATFVRYDGDRSVEDSSGMIWTMDEHGLAAEDGRMLPRIPAQRAFWFGWHAAFPNTRLVQ